jgi:hypothetical protein
MFNKNKKDAWQEHEINSITLKLIVAATLGTLAATGISFISSQRGWGEIKPELLFIPWGIALVIGVSYAFRAGVAAERARAARENQANN